MLRAIFTGLITPLVQRPARFQAAALCYRVPRAGALPEILLLTSLDTGRWIIPKGWPKAGMGAGGTALEEAWEEAGVKGYSIRPPKVGRYRYQKRLRGGIPVTTDVDVYAVEVEKMLDDYPESGRRTLRWVSPEEAAEAVDEPDLKDLLRRFPAMLPLKR